jgi:hypothetical protein
LAKTSRATLAGEGAEQEYDTNGIFIVFSLYDLLLKDCCSDG